MCAGCSAADCCEIFLQAAAGKAKFHQRERAKALGVRVAAVVKYETLVEFCQKTLSEDPCRAFPKIENPNAAGYLAGMVED